MLYAEVNYSLEVWGKYRKIIVCSRFLPRSFSAPGSFGDGRNKGRRDPYGLLDVFPGHTNKVAVDLRFWLSRLEQASGLVIYQELMCQGAKRSYLLRTSLGSAFWHIGFLIPFQYGGRLVEVRDTVQSFPKSVHAAG
jgi:hypothetical protein